MMPNLNIQCHIPRDSTIFYLRMQVYQSHPDQKKYTKSMEISMEIWIQQWFSRFLHPLFRGQDTLLERLLQYYVSSGVKSWGQAALGGLKFGKGLTVF